MTFAPALDASTPRICLVTGATSGIGLETARSLARRGAHVFVAARPGPKLDAAVSELRREPGAVRVDLLALDLADLASVHACAQTLRERVLRLDVLINNAGVAGSREVTRDGFEGAFGVNHLGHFLLTHLLLDRLRAAPGSRVVNVASDNHHWVTAVGFDGFRRPGSAAGFAEYCVSKLCNVLFTRELARRLAGSGVTTYAVHPGIVRTPVWRALLPAPIEWLARSAMLTPEQGARTTLFCATAPALARTSGRYYAPIREAKPSALAQDADLAQRLWLASERFAGITPGAFVDGGSQIDRAF